MVEQNLGEYILPSRQNREDYQGSIDPIDGRYNDEEIEYLLSEEARIASQAHVEAAIAHTYADFGKCSREVALQIETASKVVSAKEVEDREKGRGDFVGIATLHDIVALSNAISDRVDDEAKPWVHAAATSYDVISTASSIQMKRTVGQLIIPRAVILGDTIANLSERYADIVQVGRTHGQHGVPITFGFATSRYLGRLGDTLLSVKESAEVLQGKFSGAVGGYNASALINDDPKLFELALMDKLGLKPCEHATQIVPPENTLRLLSGITLISGVMAQIGEDMRNLQRTEIAEVGENFDKENQRGSSAMPQKQNPINFEQAAGVYREVLSQLFNAYLNVTSDHQRDLRDSISMRFHGIIPAMVAHTSKNLAKTLSKLDVNEFNMQRNLGITRGRIASEALQVVLRDRGRIDAYDIAKGIAKKSVEHDDTFREIVETDERTAPLLQTLLPGQRLAIVEPEHHYLGLTKEEANRQATYWQHTKSKLELV